MAHDNLSIVVLVENVVKILIKGKYKDILMMDSITIEINYSSERWNYSRTSII